MSKVWATVAVLCLYNCLTLYASDEYEVPEEEELDGMDRLTEMNPPKTENGDPIIEGDIVVPPGRRKEGLKGIINPVTFWPNGRISYNFHSSVDDNLKEQIQEGMAEWEKHSCLKFNEKMFDFNYLRFRADREGCWSMIGRINSPFSPQDVSIGPGCNRTYIIVHEIGHAIGFYHEQSRNDRDGHINILWHNMPVDKYSQFDRGIESPRGVEYDYTSIMHYPAMAFSAKHFQKNTIAARNPHYQTLIGNGKQISFRDAKLINKMYVCSAGCPNRNESMCQNGGFLSPYRQDQQPCHCVCPPRTTGEFCDEMEEPYEYYDMPPCGGNVTEETTIQTPGYPQRGPKKDSCSWWIQAPEGKRVQVEFLDFSFHERAVSNLTIFNRRCRYERVEIRTRTRYDGDMFCGEDIPPGTKATSAEREFIIIVDTTEKAMKGRGMQAKVTFVEPPEEEGEGGDGLEGDPEKSDQALKSLLPNI